MVGDISPVAFAWLCWVFFGSSSYSSHLQRPRLQPLGLWVSDWFRLSIHGCVLDQGPLQDSQATGIQPCPGLFFARTIMKASWVLSLQNASRLWSSELKSWSLHWLSTSWGSMTSNWSAKRVSVKFSLAWWKHLGWDHSVLNTQWYYAEDMDQNCQNKSKRMTNDTTLWTSIGIPLLHVTSCYHLHQPFWCYQGQGHKLQQGFWPSPLRPPGSTRPHALMP